jgi:succinate dehydrogenase / fumarate reductase, cytochrome b subunit
MPAVERPVTRPRPVYLDLVRIRLPLPGLVSILHRVSGAALFLVGIPLALVGLQSSLGPGDALAGVQALLAQPLIKLLWLGLIWAYLHHFCAGIRFLFLDVQRGIELAPARRSSVVVLVVSLALTVLVGVRLW